MLSHYNLCQFCPRACGVNRLAGETGYCGETADLRIGAAGVHHGEEPTLIGAGGSGTIFVSGCNLGCIFCQCYQVSQGEGSSNSFGKVISFDEFADICLTLRDAGVENINIVTGSHVVPAIIEGIKIAKKKGMELPFLWNSSGYDSQESLEMLKDHIDIFMPDLKTLDSKIAARFFNAPDYPDVAASAILKMADIVQKKHLQDAGVNNVCEKVVIRHLILPGFLDSTRSVLRWFANNVKGRALLSLMTQYTPVPGKEGKTPDRYVNKEEYETVMKWLDEFGISDGFFQELLTEEEWLPDFRQKNPFPPEIMVPVWTMQRYNKNE